MAKISIGYGLNDAHKRFKQLNDSKISQKDYKNICRDFNKMIVEDIKEGKEARIPHSLGMFWGKKYKNNYANLAVDFKATKDEGRTIYHLNHETDGWRVRWLWSKRNNAATNLIYYSFQPTSTNKKALSKAFRKGFGKFFSFRTL